MNTPAPPWKRSWRALLAALVALVAATLVAVTHPAHAQVRSADLRVTLVVDPLGGNNYRLLIRVSNRGPDTIVCCPGNAPTFKVVITRPDNARFGIEQLPEAIVVKTL